MAKPLSKPSPFSLVKNLNRYWKFAKHNLILLQMIQRVQILLATIVWPLLYKRSD